MPVIFVPLDTRAQRLLHSTVPRIRSWLPAYQHVGVAQIPAGARNRARDEINYVSVGRALLAKFWQAHGSRPVVLMAVTSDVLYEPQNPQLAFVFGGWIVNNRAQYAAVFGTLPMRVYQPQRENARLTKFMLRYTAEIICRLARNSNPRSVLYTPVMGTADVDRMIATLPSRCRR